MVGMEPMEPEWHWERISATGLTFPFLYGTRSLIEEIAVVQKMQRYCLSFALGHRLYAGSPHSIVIFTVPFGYEDCFIDSNEERVILLDRLRTYKNIKWKDESLTYACNANRSYNDEKFKQFRYYAGEIFNTLVRNILELHALTETLKPETRVLAGQCTSFEELHRCMLNAGV